MSNLRKEMEIPIPRSENALDASNEDQNVNMIISDNNVNISDKINDTIIDENKVKLYQDTTFINTNKVFERRKKRVLTVDVSNFLDNISENTPAIVNYSNNYWNHFKVNLQEEFHIDKLSDVYLESFTINNPAQSTDYNNLYVVIDIDEFNIKTSTNNQFMKDKFVLPNENTATSGSNKIFKYHLKSNYVATVNPKKLTSLTFKITNENNESVGINFSNAISDVNNHSSQDGYVAGELNVGVTSSTNFSIYDAVYNGNKKFIGVISGVHNKDANPHIHFINKTHIPLIYGEKLYVASSTIRTSVFSAALTEIGGTTITVDDGDGNNSNAVNDFSVGDKVYLGNGALLGTLSAVGATLLTFEEGIKHHVPNNVRMYTQSPIPKVFSSDSEFNKIIMEFVFITR